MTGRISRVMINRRQTLGQHVQKLRMSVRDEKDRPLTRASATRPDRLAMTSSTLRRVETGLDVKPGTYRLVEDYFKWPPGSMDDYVREGGALPSAPAVEAAPSEPPVVQVDRGPDAREQARRAINDDLGYLPDAEVRFVAALTATLRRGVNES